MNSVGDTSLYLFPLPPEVKKTIDMDTPGELEERAMGTFPAHLSQKKLPRPLRTLPPLLRLFILDPG